MVSPVAGGYGGASLGHGLGSATSYSNGYGYAASGPVASYAAAPHAGFGAAHTYGAPLAYAASLGYGQGYSKINRHF
ncbi:hypothetical protein B566_EDAN004027 [Ephemera danica]|nr:hypothetical protein B566_EDAN004027 [Ephemera danica]